MMRLVRLFLLAFWFVGVVTSGLTVQPETVRTTADIRLVAATDWAQLRIRAEQLVLTVGQGDRQWRAAAPLPPVLQTLLRDADDPAPGAHRAALQQASVPSL